jgi:hypothetical protein
MFVSYMFQDIKLINFSKIHQKHKHLKPVHVPLMALYTASGFKNHCIKYSSKRRKQVNIICECIQSTLLQNKKLIHFWQRTLFKINSCIILRAIILLEAFIFLDYTIKYIFQHKNNSDRKNMSQWDAYLFYEMHPKF